MLVVLFVAIRLLFVGLFMFRAVRCLVVINELRIAF